MLDDPDAVRTFLWEHGVFPPAEPLHITFLVGGVSSLVARAVGGDRCVVVKQALPQLKVHDEWLSRVERSLIEARCARVLEDLVPGAVPRVVAVGEARRAFVMACAPAGARTWKELLMEGTTQVETARAAGTLLGRIHARSATHPELAEQFEDRSFFEELRLDPYLRTIARRHSDLSDPLQRIIACLLNRRLCLVHGDYSPKNLLVPPGGGLLLLDHEVAHWGNPAFDAAFVLSHLCLKALKFPQCAAAYVACARAAWAAYLAQQPPGLPPLVEHTALVLGALLLARVDGKSPVEYLQTEDERHAVRSLARKLIAAGVSDLDAVLDRVAGAHVHA